MDTLTNTVNKILGRKNADPGQAWDMVAKTLVCTAFFLTPLAVGWWSADIWETYKMLLLLLAVSGGWVCFWIASLRRRTVTWQWSRLDWLVVGIILVTGLSTVTSISPWHAFIPFNGWYAETVPGVMVLAVLYLLTVQLFRQRHDQLLGWASLVGGLVVACLFQLFQFSNFSLWPLNLPSSPLFNPISGSTESLAVVAGLVSSLALLGWTMAKERWHKLLIALTGLMGWLVLLFSSQALGWAVFALGMMLVVLSQSQQGAKANTKLIGVAVALVVLGMLAQFTTVTRYTSIQPVNDSKLDTKTSAAITLKAMSKYIPFGSGPGTWYYDFVSLRPTTFNQSPFWNVRFTQASNQWWHLAATVGVFGVIAWMTWLVTAVIVLWRRWQTSGEWTAAAGLLVALTSLLTSFFGTWSLVLMVLFFGSFGLIRAVMLPDGKSRPLSVWSGLGFTATLLLVLSWWWPAGRVIASDVTTRQATLAVNRVEPIEQVEKRLARALEFNPRNLNAASLLANAYLVELQLSIQKNDAAQNQAITQKIAQHLNRLREIDPNNPAGYEISNNVLSALTGVIGDVELEAQRNFQALRTLEPASPIHDVGYGQTLMVQRARMLGAESVTDEQKDQAEQLRLAAIAAYEIAIRKKPDYVQAQIARVQAFAAGAEYDQALAALDPLLVTYPQLSGLWVQQADIFSLLKRNDEAVAAYEQALRVDRADAIIYLSFATHYQRLTDTTKAKEVLARGLEVLPGNSDLQQALDSLK